MQLPHYATGERGGVDDWLRSRRRLEQSEHSPQFAEESAALQAFSCVPLEASTHARLHFQVQVRGHVGLSPPMVDSEKQAMPDRAHRSYDPVIKHIGSHVGCMNRFRGRRVKTFV
jgi:hypothetical protein